MSETRLPVECFPVGHYIREDDGVGSDLGEAMKWIKHEGYNQRLPV